MEFLKRDLLKEAHPVGIGVSMWPVHARLLNAIAWADSIHNVQVTEDGAFEHLHCLSVCVCVVCV